MGNGMILEIGYYHMWKAKQIIQKEYDLFKELLPVVELSVHSGQGINWEKWENF